MPVNRKYFIPILMLSLLIFFFQSYSNIDTVSALYDSVANAVSKANSGDIVVVRPGTVIWAKQLVITKGITLQGSGFSKTIVTSNYTATTPSSIGRDGNFLILYKPSNPALNEPFRLTGFTLDLNYKCSGIGLKNETVFTMNSIPHRVRIDHNTLKNAYRLNTIKLLSIFVNGICGVIDNNTFIDCHKIGCEGKQRLTWDNQAFDYGTVDNMYIEDNEFTIPDNGLGVAAGYGGRYCVRYNTFTSFSTTDNLSPWFDAHGNQHSGVYGTMGVEIYGNKLIFPNRSGIMFDHRGGKGLCFFNDLGTGSFFTAKVREERPDSISFTTNIQSQHVSNSYYWNNRRNDAIITFFTETLKKGIATEVVKTIC